MNRRERTEILAQLSFAEISDLIIDIEKKYMIQMVEPPNSGLVMMKLRESAKNTQYFIGELFVSECKVMIDDVLGLGILQGSHMKKVYAMAVIDALFNLNATEVSSIEKKLLVHKQDIEKLKGKERSQILKTKVDFETLDEEVKS